MKKDVNANLEELRACVAGDGIPLISSNEGQWGGADVVILGEMDDQTRKWLDEQPVVISPQSTEPRRRAIVTRHSQELSWLFLRLKALFADRIDFVSKYDFYGLLAKAALDHIEANGDGEDCKPLLLAVLARAEEMARE